MKPLRPERILTVLLLSTLLAGGAMLAFSQANDYLAMVVSGYRMSQTPPTLVDPASVAWPTAPDLASHIRLAPHSAFGAIVDRRTPGVRPPASVHEVDLADIAFPDAPGFVLLASRPQGLASSDPGFFIQLNLGILVRTSGGFVLPTPIQPEVSCFLSGPQARAALSQAIPAEITTAFVQAVQSHNLRPAIPSSTTTPSWIDIPCPSRLSRPPLAEEMDSHLPPRRR